jgi:phosphoenolpyruvate-protein phosphotransferase (PTS system enzyme I)
MPNGETQPNAERRFVGIGVSPGIVTGKIFLYGRHELPISRKKITTDDVPQEIARLEQALITTRHQLQEIQKRITQDLGEADAGALFDAHLLVLDDPSLIDEVVKGIQKGTNAESAFDKVATRYVRTLSNVEDEYLRERAADIKDVAHRVLRNLQGHHTQDLRNLEEPCIVLAYDMAPSDTAAMDRTKVIGFGTDIGSKTSHTAIMAGAMEIPAVVGLHDATQQVEAGTPALLDGYGGVLIINPTEQTLYEYGQIESKRHSIEVSFEALKDLPAETLDNKRVLLNANIEMPEDIPHVLANGADGVGLFRTEYIFINRDDLPSEDEQFRAYYEVAEKLNPRPVIIRSLDLGGDKFLSHLQVANEMNPFLGWRAIRFCLERTDIFRTQLRAILRASVLGNVSLMYPMISGLNELRQANAELEAARNELRAKGIAFNDKMPVGTMIEVPSAAVIADLLARECQFFSIGTNDLIQYSLAVDRVNEKIAHLYQPSHPCIIRLIHQVIEAAHRANIKVSICGEMAGDVALIPILIGLKLDELSANPPSLPQMKKLIRSLKISDTENLARMALELSTSEEIRKISADLARSSAPDVMELSGN